jgi:uncharacterized delta-60 repeat protein
MRTMALLAVASLSLTLAACGNTGIQANKESLTALALRTAGTLDTSYGTLGLVVPEGSFSAGLNIQRDGKALVFTGTGDIFKPAFRATLTRLMPNGKPDTGFGTGGAIQLEGGVGALALVCPNGANSYNDWGAACEAPERPEVAVTFTSRDIPAQTILKVYRFLPSGQPDTSFGTGGVLLAPATWTSYVTNIAIQADGKTLLAGNSVDGLSVYLTRLKRNGTPDSEFGNGGLVTLPNVSADGQFEIALALPQSEHPVVLTLDNQSGATNVYRFTDDGKPDQQFGTGGKVQLTSGALDGTGRALLELDDGRLVVAGTNGLWRLLANGTLDANFGIGGHANVPFDINNLVLDDQNRLVAVVDAPRARGEATIARLKFNGTPDSSFGIGGVATVNLCPQGCGLANFDFNAIALQRNGRILAEATEFFHSSFAVTVARMFQ